MAKSVRASVSKRNRANLRKKVFGPVVDARTERLAAKLQEIASQPRVKASEKTEMDLETDETGMTCVFVLFDGFLFPLPSSNPIYDLADKKDGAQATANEEMDIDNKSSKSRSQKSGRVQKRNRRTRPSIVFQSHSSKAKKGSKKK
ncbi:hypothetical protein N7462_008788 [Penicillium macrosclerotiorum]|uniref:uncharacterized protein n=1 Tax=Penicillium macrosclerotiorum TaxID=303699 RepID=UPI00254898C4|nr:uncharacterized protein N7462_008788 [Penicillium macrosclerotiorum]KAJ5675891.1 hypothetical protein N7462_008788 [Penicillium macrosclerotiorum]